ncbi:MAG: hypothetical protein JWN78_222 [Bacteroidota bacterium]|nr:hypothetical protein [Bacteroidota bacterium]
MTRVLKIIYLITSTITYLTSCQQHHKQIKSIPTPFIPMKSNYVQDTITPDGWNIKYLVKNDSTKESDLYIECSKASIKTLYYRPHFLEFKEYFIPKFIGETNSFLFFKHGCASDCAAILVVNKKRFSSYTDYQDVINYNINLQQILYVTQKAYKDGRLYDLSLVNLTKNREQNIQYSSICDATYKPSCVDTVIFSQNKVIIKTTLRKNINTLETITETKEIIP